MAPGSVFLASVISWVTGWIEEWVKGQIKECMNRGANRCSDQTEEAGRWQEDKLRGEPRQIHDWNRKAAQQQKGLILFLPRKSILCQHPLPLWRGLAVSLFLASCPHSRPLPGAEPALFSLKRLRREDLWGRPCLPPGSQLGVKRFGTSTFFAWAPVPPCLMHVCLAFARGVTQRNRCGLGWSWTPFREPRAVMIAM